MLKWKSIFAIALIAAYPLAFLFTHFAETTHRSDSIGLWYTLYVSAVFAILGATIVVFVLWAVTKLRARRLRGGA